MYFWKLTVIKYPIGMVSPLSSFHMILVVFLFFYELTENIESCVLTSSLMGLF
jgi:hypothetical protein